MPKTVVASGPIDLRATLAPLAALPGDPTLRAGPGRFERATWTPEGPASLIVTWAGGDGTAGIETFGDGAKWLIERVPGLLGCEDDTDGFAPDSQPLRNLWRLHSGDRVGRTATVWHDAAWFIVQQRVARADAASQWRRLVLELGTPAPGVPELQVPPEPSVIARVGYDDLHRYGIERKRADALMQVARVAQRLQTFADRDVDAASAALLSVRGIGQWTGSCLLAQTWGSADTVIRGDAGIPALVTWLLAGERTGSEERMLQLLAPYSPHRYRVIRLAFLSGIKPPRHGPRGVPNDIRRR